MRSSSWVVQKVEKSGKSALITETAITECGNMNSIWAKKYADAKPSASSPPAPLRDRLTTTAAAI